MHALRRFWSSSLVGAALVGCLSLFLLAGLCVTLAGIHPQFPVRIPTKTTLSPIPTDTASLSETPTKISPTSTSWMLPTNTVPPTKKVDITPKLVSTEPALATATLSPGQPASTLSCIPNTTPKIGKVLDVVDGDTITVLLDGLVVKVKYIGIDAPESVTRLEYLGKEARARNQELVFGRDVLLYKDISDRDRFDHLLRYVLVEDRFVNLELVSLGYANALDEAPNSACDLQFTQAASGARDRSLGIWAPHTPLPEQSLAAEGLIIFSVNKEAEFVDIQNTTDTAFDLSGWHLVSEVGKQECKLSGIIQPSEILRIFSGSKQPGFSCGFDQPIWDASQTDSVVLYSPDGRETDRYP